MRSSTIWLSLVLAAVIGVLAFQFTAVDNYEDPLGAFSTPRGGSAPTLSSDWSIATCLPNGVTTQLTADTERLCDSFAFVEDANGVLDTVAAAGGSPYFRLRAGATGGTTAAGDGVGISFATAFARSATTTLMMQTSARIGAIQQATSTSFTFIGFANTTGLSPDYAAMPSGCMLTASSTAANWIAACRVPITGTYSQVDTGVASSTVLTGDGSFRRFRVNMDGTAADFYIQSPGGTLTRVAQITGASVPSTAALNPIVAIGKNHVGTTHELHVRDLQVWYLDPLW
jgi:hypothetical protein